VTTYAEPEDLELRFPRELTDAEVDRLPTLLEDASFWLGVWLPGLDDAVTTNEQVAQAAKLTVVSMVRRSLLTTVPDDPNVSATTQVAGAFQYQVTYRNPEGNLFLYDRELAALMALMRPYRGDAVSMTSPGL
jgi:hypothetical protein